MLNAARTTIYAANYDPYGQVMAQYLPDATPSFGFTGQMTDASGLQYLRARYYNPSTGTFLSQDPVQGMPGGASIRWNPYIYAGGNPTTYVDPNGEWFWIAAFVTAASWFARGAAVDIGMQMTLGGRGLHNLDLRSAVISGGIDVATGGMSTYAKGLGYSAQVVNRLDFAADVALSAGADVAFFGDDPLAALAGNAAFGAGGRAAAHQAGRGIRAGARRLGIGGGGGATPSIGCRANSFSEDTPISTSEGDVMISEVEQGAKVYAYDEDTGEVDLYTVLDTIVHEDDTIAYVTIDGEVIETTPWHLFYTDEGWQEVEDLEAGDLVLSLDEHYGTVEGVTIVAKTQVMYDLTVEEVHTFAVGAGRWVVHNQDKVCLRFANQDDPNALLPPLMRNNPTEPWFDIAERLRQAHYPATFDEVWKDLQNIFHLSMDEWISFHARGDHFRMGIPTPFVSVTDDLSRALRTTDSAFLQPIIYGNRNKNIAVLNIPKNRLIQPSQDLSLLEGEYLFLGGDLDRFVVGWLQNPFMGGKYPRLTGN